MIDTRNQAIKRFNVLLAVAREKPPKGGFPSGKNVFGPEHMGHYQENKGTLGKSLSFAKEGASAPAIMACCMYYHVRSPFSCRHVSSFVSL